MDYKVDSKSVAKFLQYYWKKQYNVNTRVSKFFPNILQEYYAILPTRKKFPPMWREINDAFLAGWLGNKMANRK